MPVLGDELLLESRAPRLSGELPLGCLRGQLESLGREIGRDVGADQLLAGVPQDSLERGVDLGEPLVHRDRCDRLVRVLEEIPVARLAGARRSLRARSLDRDAGDVRGELDDLDVVGAAVARLAVVEGERAEQRAVGGEYRRRPASTQPGIQRQPAEVGPQRVVRDVRDGHALAAVGGGAARSDARADRDAVDRLAVGRRKAGRRAVAQVHAVAIEQQDGCLHVFAVLLHERRETHENLRQRRSACDELEQPGLTRRERLRALAVADIACGRCGADDGAGGVQDRRDRRLDVDARPVLADADGFQRFDPLAPAQALVDELEQVALARQEQFDRMTDHLLGAVAEDALRRRIPPRHESVGRSCDDRVE